MTIETRPFDPASYLDSEAAVVEYLTAALETRDPGFVADALDVIARARGMTQVAQDAGVGRESLYKAFRKALTDRLEGGSIVSTDELVSVKNFWRLFENSIRSTHVHATQKYMERYLGEFRFRANYRDRENAMFDLLVGAL